MNTAAGYAPELESVLTLLAGLGSPRAGTPQDIKAALSAGSRPDARWHIFSPFDEVRTTADAARDFFVPLAESFPDLEYRMNLVLAGDYHGGVWVSTLGCVLGSFERSWIGIPATHGLVFLKFALNARVVDGQVAEAYIHLDVIDVMRQAGYYPLRVMPGSAEQWPAPPVGAGRDSDAHRSADTMRIVREMQVGLGMAGTEEEPHSAHWHPNMNWYGPAGIGSTRGERGFMEYHCAPMEQGFPDAADPAVYYGRNGPGAEPEFAHYIQAAQGRLAVTGGWPSLVGTHAGGGFLGVPPSGREVEWRVADWYRLDDDGRIVDNWVMIDLVYILRQSGLDILDELRCFADPTRSRYPVRAPLFPPAGGERRIGAGH